MIVNKQRTQRMEQLPKLNELIDHFYKLYFNPGTRGPKDSMYRPFESQYKSYSQFLHGLKHYFEADDKEYYNKIVGDVEISGRIIISNFHLEHQKLCDDSPMNPRMARLTGTTLNCDGIGDVKQIIRLSWDTRQSNTDASLISVREVKEYVIAEDLNSKILTVPLMITEGGRTDLTPFDYNNYSPIEFGGYFIIKGNEKIASNSMTMVLNRPRIYLDDKSFKIYLHSYSESKQIQYISIKNNNRKSNLVSFSSQRLNDVNIFCLIRYFGLTDKMIMSIILKNDTGLMSTAEKWLVDSRSFGMSDFEHIKSKTNKHVGKNQGQVTVSDILQEYFENDFLPHLETKSLVTKATYLSYLVNKLLRCVVTGSDIRYYDKDSIVGKQFLTVGYYFKYIVRNAMTKIMRKITDTFYSSIDTNNKLIQNIIKTGNVSEVRNILGSFTTAEITNDLGVLVSIGTFKTYSVISNIERYSIFSFPYAARKINKALKQPKQAITKMLDARDSHVSHIGFLDPNETPEHGGNTGLTLSLALVSSISVVEDHQEKNVHAAIIAFYKTKLDYMVEVYSDTVKFVFILESKIIDFVHVDYAYKFYLELRHAKQNGDFIEDDIGIIYDYSEQEIRINTFSGRLTKPLLLFDETGHTLKIDRLSQTDKNKFLELTSFTEVYNMFPNIFEVVDAEQFVYSMVCISSTRAIENKLSIEYGLEHTKVGEIKPIELFNYELLEAPPDLLMSFMSSSMPAPNFIMGTRVIFGTSQIKATGSIVTPDFKNTIANSMFMPGPERPILSCKAFDYTRIPMAGFGQNCMVAVCPYFGFEKDDAIVVKRSSVERGILTVEVTKKFIKQVDVGNETNSLSTCIRVTNNFGKLNSRGYNDIGTVVENGDVLVKNIIPISKQTTTGELITIDNSEIYVHNFPGRVTTHVINQQTNKKEHRIQTNSFRGLVPGDKLGTRSAQKGTISEMFPDNLMPYDEDGVSPDLIVNPLASTSRKTGSFWIEALLGACFVKSGCKWVDFKSFDGSIDGIIEYATKILGPDLSEKTLYDPITNKPMKAKVFMAPMYYSASKHKVDDKAYGRSKGATNNITRQANGGRGKGGGLRFGEMERDCLIAQAASDTLHEILSDPYDSALFTYICDTCGLQARYTKDMFGVERQVCTNCPVSKIHKINSPFVLGTLNNESLSRGIKMELKCE